MTDATTELRHRQSPLLMEGTGSNRVSLMTGRRLLQIAHPEVLKMAKYYTQIGFIEPLFFEDAVQDIMIHLYERREKILGQFMTRSSFKTYLYSIIRNRFMTLFTSRKYKVIAQKNPLPMLRATDYSQLNVSMKEEYKRLGSLLEVIDQKTNRLVICLKARYRIRIEVSELLAYMPVMDASDIDKIMEVNHFKNTRITDREIYHVLANVFTRYEKKLIRPDSLRKWADYKLEILRTKMNANDKDAVYSSETLQLLIEYYFASSQIGPVCVSSCA